MKNIITTMSLAGVDVLNHFKNLLNCFEPRAIDWFELLPQHAHIKAVRNARKSGHLYTRYNTLKDALTQSFDPKNTFEGAGYWQKIINKYC
jgi:hypothetical protein